MRILVTGASGFIGRRIAERLAGSHQVTGTFCRVDAPIPGCALERVDLALEPDGLRRLICRLRPDLVVHAAATADPDACERSPEGVRTVNVAGTEAAARGAVEAKSRLFYISTDLIFDGGAAPYREEDAPGPLSLYARTKLDGERRTRELCPSALVLRMSLCYGWNAPAGKETFTDFLFAAFSAGRRPVLFSDQYRAALYVSDAAEIIGRLAERTDLSGRTFHLAGPERISRVRFGELFCDAFGFARGLIDARKMADVPSAAPRPLDCSLDGSRLNALLGFTPRSVEEAFRDMKIRGGGHAAA